jgi:penicillin-binding protein 2
MFPLADRRQLLLDDNSTTVVNARGRLRLLVAGFVLVVLIVSARAGQLEMRQGAASRTEALRPVRRSIALPATRGRILARDNTVLAADRELLALAVHYRYLQREPETAWLRSQLRFRVPKGQRRDRARLAAEELALRKELKNLNARLAELCGLSTAAWQSRAKRVEQQVESLAAHVNERRRERFEAGQLERSLLQVSTESPWWNVWRNMPDALLALATPEAETLDPVIVAEQVDYHIMVEDLPSATAAEIRGHAERYPGVRVLDVPRRTYPAGSLAANVLGHLGHTDEQVENGAKPLTRGLMGIERACEAWLAGVPGEAEEEIDRRGKLLATNVERDPLNGHDLELTLDVQLQQAAEAILDRALERNGNARGGAIVVLDVHGGDVLALASAPRFDPNAFALSDTERIARTLRDAGRPLFDRATRMALPPGSLFAPIAAVAMLESGRVPSQTPFHCQGYLHDPDSLRCPIYRQQGEGHGDVTLADALARHCNVYFLHYAGVIGADPLVACARRFGFGTTTGILLPDEVRGNLPLPISRTGNPQKDWANGDAQLLAIGQGAVTVTPLQMARAFAAIANGGRLLTPRLVRNSAEQSSAGIQIGNLSSSALAQIREGMHRAIENTVGDAHDALSTVTNDVAGLIATGEVAGATSDHAWCAGYVPAATPRYAFVVCIEHAGDGLHHAAPLAKRLLTRMRQLGFTSATSESLAGPAPRP